LIGISTSGNSPNIVEACKTARELGLKIIAMTGSRDSGLSRLADVTLRSPSTRTPRIQEIHGLLLHSLCRAIEEEIFPGKAAAPALPASKIIQPGQLPLLAAAIKGYESVFTTAASTFFTPATSTSQRSQSRRLLIVELNTDDPSSA
jgi:hypothetical protein